MREPEEAMKHWSMVNVVHFNIIVLIPDVCWGFEYKSIRLILQTKCLTMVVKLSIMKIWAQENF